MNWELICYLLEEFGIIQKNNAGFSHADTICLMDESVPILDNTVYVCDGIPKYAGHSLRHSLIIIISEQSYVSGLISWPDSSSIPEQLSGEIRLSAPDTLYRPDTVSNPDEDYLLNEASCIILKKGPASQVLNKLLIAKSHLDILTELLSDLTDNQSVIDAASRFLGVPFFYFDASYRILAITKNMHFENDPEWEHMTEKGFFSPESLRLMRESGDLDLLADKHDPFPYKAKYFPFESLVCNIWNENQFISRLNMLCTDTPPDEMKKQECRIICKCLLRTARSSETAFPYTGPLKSMVLDLLRGLQLSEELISDRLSALPQIKNNPGQVCCIEPKVKNDPRLLNYYTSLIERIFETDSVVTLEFDGNIVLILHAKDSAAFGALHAKLSDFLLSQGLKCGAGSLFHRFSTLRDHYLQALNTMLIGKKDQGINYFHDNYYDYILSFIPRDQAMAMISYQIIRLLQLQKDYQFPLAQTLRKYLECGCNLQMTAEKLFIHKNTALYRINHIREILEADLDDTDVRMQLLFSFKILETYPVKL